MGSSVIVPVRIELELQRRGKALKLRVTRLAVDDQRDYWPLRMTRLEEANVFTHVVALGGGRRTDDDQRVRGVERGKCQRVGVRAGGVVGVAKDRAQRLWMVPVASRPIRSLSPRKPSSQRCNHFAQPRIVVDCRQ